MNLIECIAPDPGILKSVNLERDMGNTQTLSNYILTDKGLLILNQFLSAIKEQQSGAWALIGPYGMGKSAFSNFLLSLTGPETDPKTATAQDLLQKKDSSFLSKYQKVCKQHDIHNGFIRIAVTSAHESINSSLVRGLLKALKKNDKNCRSFSNKKRSSGEPTQVNGLIQMVEKLNKVAYPPTKAVMELVKKTKAITQCPILIIVDEFGKNLEYMAHNEHEGDIYILQLLAESSDLFIWVCLHQAFDEYASAMSDKQLNEWGKIQGRFTDISFVESKDQMLTFLQNGLVSVSDTPQLSGIISKWSLSFHKEIQAANLPILSRWTPETIAKLFPLHPLVAFLLPDLCTTFAQNDRTLFSFMGGHEPGGLFSHLQATSVLTAEKNDCTFRLDQVYDYFFNTTTHLFGNKSTTQRWLEINDIISNTRSQGSNQIRLLKSIGVLNLISGKSGIASSTSMLRLALLNPLNDPAEDRSKIDEEIKRLIQEKTLIYRHYANEYRLWEGSDFDVPKAIEKKKAALHTKPIDDILNQILPLDPLIASRHSYETGTMRRFKLQWVAYDRINPDVLTDWEQDGFDGLLLYCFGRKKRIKFSHLKTKSKKPLLVAYASNEAQILEMLLDAAAANDILQNAPELVRDPVARKEARFIASSANAHLKKHLGQAFSPLSRQLMWFADGQKHKIFSDRELSSFISRQCDEVYSGCPQIKNEMINYNKISSAASKARRELIDVMLTHGHEETLGLQGMGPTVALYRSMLKHFDLHRFDPDNNIWQLIAPEEGNNFYPVWKAIDDLMAQSGQTHTPVEDIFSLLKKPPFGLKAGPIPIIVCFYLIVRSDEVAIYQEGIYIPLVDVAEMELLVKRPDLFSLRYFNPVGISQQVFQIYKTILNAQAEPQEKQIRNASMVNIVGPLMQFAKQLPQYSQTTRMLSEFAMNVRTALLRCNEPIELLFDALPKALHMPPFDEKKTPDSERITEFQEKFREAIVELAEVYPNLLDKLGNTILNVFNEEGKSIDGLKETLSQRIDPLRNQCTERELSSIMRAICKPSDTNHEWIESVAGCAMKKTVGSWRDTDLAGFPAVISNIYTRLNKFEALVLDTGASPRKKKNNHTSRSVVSVMLSNGTHFQETIEVDQKTKSKLKEHFSKLNTLTTHERKVFMTMLAHSVMEKE